MKKKTKWFLATSLTALAVAIGYSSYTASTQPDMQSVSYRTFEKDLNQKAIESINIHNSYTQANEVVYYKLEDKDKPLPERTYYKVLVPSFDYFWSNFDKNPDNKNIQVMATPIPEEGFLGGLLRNVLFFGVILGGLFLLQFIAMGKMKRENAQLISPDDIDIGFEDIIGIDNVKQEVMEIVDFLKNPDKYRKTGAMMPKGLILSGSPGTGKTMLAKALAKEANVPVFYCSGSAFVEMYVGLGASRVRHLFDKANRVAPCIIFIDEIETIGAKRNSSMLKSNQEQENTLNELLTQMDGMTSNKGIFIMGATNRVDMLDEALMRAGRFDRQIVVPLPHLDGRLELIERLVKSKSYQFDPQFNFSEAARGLMGMSGAEITNLMNEAAILQARYNKEYIDKSCWHEAIDKIRIGHSNGLRLTEKDKRITAYHEAGHAVVGLMLNNLDPVHKVSITPRGNALGVTVSLPEEDRVSYSVDYLLSQITMLYGGFCAEKLFIGVNTTGASNDIERATALARNMVTKWFGLNFNQTGKPPLLYTEKTWSYDNDSYAHASEQLKQNIEQEIQAILQHQFDRAEKILNKYDFLVKDMVNALLEKETIDEHDIYQLLKTHDLSIPKYLEQYAFVQADHINA